MIQETIDLRPVYGKDLDFILRLKNDRKIQGKGVGSSLPFTEGDFQTMLHMTPTGPSFHFIGEKAGIPVGLICLEVNFKDRKGSLMIDPDFKSDEDYKLLYRKILVACLKYLEGGLNLTKVSVKASADHPELMAILDNAGFFPEVLKREDIFRDGKFIDVTVYSRISGQRKEQS